MVNRVALVDGMREVEAAVKVIEAAMVSTLVGVQPPQIGEPRFAVHYTCEQDLFADRCEVATE